MPSMEDIHQDLRKKGVTLQLLWYEYKRAHPDGYQYSQFCYRYHRWADKLDVCLRQTYRAGEKLFVDYAGQTMPVTDPVTGAIRDAISLWPPWAPAAIRMSRQVLPRISLPGLLPM